MVHDLAAAGQIMWVYCFVTVTFDSLSHSPIRWLWYFLFYVDIGAGILLS